MNKVIKYFASVVGVLLAGILLVWGLWSISWHEKKPTINIPAFAQCLADKKVTMYGAYWCQHCQNQKALFGDAFKLVPYVECTENTKLCTEKGIEGFPTWLVPDGKGGETKLEGEQTFDDLAKASGCVLTPAK